MRECFYLIDVQSIRSHVYYIIREKGDVLSSEPQTPRRSLTLFLIEVARKPIKDIEEIFILNCGHILLNVSLFYQVKINSGWI